MQEPIKLTPSNLSFESLKKINEHGIEYWSARDLQPYLGYTEWRTFENTIKKAIASCKQSGNNPQNHFVGAHKMIGIGVSVNSPYSMKKSPRNRIAFESFNSA
jgi:DNA-damage-inducible protein D